MGLLVGKDREQGARNELESPGEPSNSAYPLQVHSQNPKLDSLRSPNVSWEARFPLPCHQKAPLWRIREVGSRTATWAFRDHEDPSLPSFLAPRNQGVFNCFLRASDPVLPLACPGFVRPAPQFHAIGSSRWPLKSKIG